jgi:hypothetical protein
MAGPSPAPAQLQFSGFEWDVRQAGVGGPGPNHWEPANVGVDAAGRLHLKLRRKGGVWYGCEVTLRRRLGFGAYEFIVEGPVDRLDRNVVLGLFNYPTPDVGVDGTHEIDVEFSHWGNPAAPILNYTVWPADPALKPDGKAFRLTLPGGVGVHRFDWAETQVVFETRAGEANGAPVHRFVFAPADPKRRISQAPEPVHMNLWCFQGRPPTDGREVEIIIRSFRHAPAGRDH